MRERAKKGWVADRSKLRLASPLLISHLEQCKTWLGSPSHRLAARAKGALGETTSSRYVSTQGELEALPGTQHYRLAIEAING